MIGSSYRFSDVIGQLKKRKSYSHKGDYGRILIIGGDGGMGGAGGGRGRRSPINHFSQKTN